MQVWVRAQDLIVHLSRLVAHDEVIAVYDPHDVSIRFWRPYSFQWEKQWAAAMNDRPPMTRIMLVADVSHELKISWHDVSLPVRSTAEFAHLVRGILTPQANGPAVF